LLNSIYITNSLESEQESEDIDDNNDQESTKDEVTFVNEATSNSTSQASHSASAPASHSSSSQAEASSTRPRISFRNGQNYTFEVLQAYAQLTHHTREAFEEGCCLCRKKFTENDIKDMVAVICGEDSCREGFYHMSCLGYHFFQSGFNCPQCTGADFKLNKRVKVPEDGFQDFEAEFFS
jgi:hypothetical protein